MVALPVNGGGELEGPPAPPEAEGIEEDAPVPEGAGLPPVGYGASMEVGYSVALAVETTLVATAADVEPGAAVVTGAAVEVAWAVVSAGALAAHWHTAAAEDCTTSPVTAPQPETTQGSAAVAMAADCDALHWQAKSCASQPIPEAAELIQDT